MLVRPLLLLGLLVVSSSTLLMATYGRQPAGAGAIIGQVVDALTGRPIAEAVVQLGSVGRETAVVQRQLTTEAGRFAFVDLPAPGGYVLTVTRSGYLDG